MRLIDDLSRQEDEWWLWPKLGFQRLDYVSCLKERDNVPSHVWRIMQNLILRTRCPRFACPIFFLTMDSLTNFWRFEIYKENVRREK